MTDSRPLFYSTTDVATMLGCSGEHVRNLVKAGRIRTHQGLGRKILIPCGEVDRLTGSTEFPGHEVVSSGSRRNEVIRELRQKHAEIGLLLMELEGN